MEKLSQVQDAKALLSEATTWSVMKWLREKKRVRAIADQANALLDALRHQTQQSWPEELQAEYVSMKTDPRNGQEKQHRGNGAVRVTVKKVWEADYIALQAREEAEKTFDDAEKQLSTRLAREGCQKAIQSWELHEKAIEKASALVRAK